MTYYIGNRNREKTNETRFIIKMAKWLKLIELHGGLCLDCGKVLTDYPWIAQFHHSDIKNNEIGILSSCSFQRMKNEADHCTLLCENCHRKLHENIDIGKKPNINKILFLEYKNTKSCVKCGYDNNYKSLDFHHIDSKKYEISDLVTKGNKFIAANLEDIENELDKCIVLCANCHRSEHFNIDKYTKLLHKINDKKEILKDNYTIKVDHFEVMRLHTLGISQLKISKEINCGLSTVCGILKSNNIHTIINQPIVDKIFVTELINEGFTNSEIHRKLGYSRQVIAKIRKNVVNIP